MSLSIQNNLRSDIYIIWSLIDLHGWLILIKLDIARFEMIQLSLYNNNGNNSNNNNNNNNMNNNNDNNNNEDWEKNEDMWIFITCVSL